MFRPRPALLSAAFVAALAACVPAALAQNLTGTISGIVADEQGQPVPGATVTVINEATGDARMTTTDRSGDFQITNLQPASYTVRVEMPNFRKVERTKNVLSAAERLSIGTLTLRSDPRRDRHRRGDGHPGQHRRNAAQRPDHLEADRADPG